MGANYLWTCSCHSVQVCVWHTVSRHRQRKGTFLQWTLYFYTHIVCESHTQTLQCFTMHHKLELGCHLCGRESWHGGAHQIFAYVQIFAHLHICVNICICTNICTHTCVWGKVDTVALPGGASAAAWGGGEPGHSLPQDLSWYLFSVFVFVSVFRICLCICILYLSLYLCISTWKCHSICCCTAFAHPDKLSDQWSGVFHCAPSFHFLSATIAMDCLISTHTEYLCNVSSGFVTPEREKPRLFVISAHKDGFVTAAGLVTTTCQLARC